MTCQSNSS